MNKHVLLLLLFASVGCASSSRTYWDMGLLLGERIVRHFPSEGTAVASLANGDYIVGKVRVVDLCDDVARQTIPVPWHAGLLDPPIILCFGLEVTLVRDEYGALYLKDPPSLLWRLLDPPGDPLTGASVSGGEERFDKTVISRDESGVIILDKITESESQLTVSYSGVAVGIWPVREGTIGPRLGRIWLHMLEAKHGPGVFPVWADSREGQSDAGR